VLFRSNEVLKKKKKMNIKKIIAWERAKWVGKPRYNGVVRNNN